MIEYENLGKANEPFFSEYQEAFARTLKSGWYILGANVAAFEREFAAYLNSAHCVGVASGLDALILALRAFNLPSKSEVIVPSNTYIATILAIVQNGFVPVLVEPDIQTYNIDPSKIEERITPRTKALVIVHLYGKSCDMDPIVALCRRYNLKLLEDCAQSHGARYRGKLTGTFGEIGAFSFYPTKNLGALGDAGAITTEDNQLAETVRILRNYGSKIKYYNELVGYNSRLDEVLAAFLLVKLKHLDAINNKKRALADIYFNNLKDDFIKPTRDPDFFDVYHIFNVRHPRRDALREYLSKKEIKTEIHYPVSPHRQKAMQNIITGDYPISDEIHQTTLSLPCSFAHTADEILKVCEVMNAF
jgi:dTDP-4-amino-4,6-dideoxygalactose transaminase